MFKPYTSTQTLYDVKSGTAYPAGYSIRSALRGGYVDYAVSGSIVAILDSVGTWLQNVYEFATGGGSSGTCNATPALVGSVTNGTTGWSADNRVGNIATLAAPASVCSVEVYFGTATGTPTGTDYVYIYSIDGSDNLVTLLGTSQGVSESGITPNAYNTFTFSTPVNLSAGSYAIVWAQGTHNSSNYYSVGYGDKSGTTWPGNMARWPYGSAILDYNAPTWVMGMKVHYAQ